LKKFITIILGALFVLGLAATAFAIHAEIPAETQAVVARGETQITLGGNIRVRGWYLNDIVDIDLGEFDEELSGIGTRLPGDVGSSSYYDQRVRLQLDAASGNTSGRIHLESQSGSSDVYTWGNFESKPSTVSFLEAWIQHKFDIGVPAGIKIGHMPLSLGPAKLFYDHTKFGDDAIVFFMDPTANTHIAALTIKVSEGTAVADITDFAPPIGVGNVANADDTDAYVALINHKLGNTQLGAYYVYINSSDFETKLQDVGVHAAGSVAGLSYTAQADVNFGEFDATTDAEGWAAWLELGYKVDPVGIRVMGAIGSGQDDSADLTAFINFLGANRYYTVVYDYQLAGANLTRFNGVSNTTVLNAGVDLKPMDKLAIAIDGYWLKATDTEGIEALVGSSVDDDLGWEVDVKASYSLAKNLKYFAWAGYMKTGDFYEAVFGPEFNQDPTVVMHGLEYAF